MKKQPLHPEDVFKRYFPAEVVSYCLDLWKKYSFKFTISKKRNSKLGDYRYYRLQNTHAISVNSDLNKFSFLITYLHEVAHLTTQIKYGNGILPHGNEWKSEFKLLMNPVLQAYFLPQDIQLALVNYMNNPGASSCSDHNLLKTLHKYDKGFSESVLFLSDLEIGREFEFNGKKFRKDSVRRTKALCTEMGNNKKYLISLVAKVNI